jgi:hypothetical protein
MKRLLMTAVVLLSFAACSKTKTGQTAAADAAAAAPASAATTTSLVQKALSFLTGGPFEGEITTSMTMAGKPTQTITYVVKGDKMRFDVPTHVGPAGDSYALFDRTTKKITTVTDSKKMAFVIDMGAAPHMVGSAATSQTKPEVQKTGKMDTVAGYSCEIWKITATDGSTGEACVAKGVTFPVMGIQSAWAAGFGDSFPLRVVMNDKAGKELVKFEVTKVDKKTVDDKRLEVPAGYKTMNMGDMMKSFSGMQGGAMGHPMPR